MQQVVTGEWASQQACNLIAGAWAAFAKGQYVAAYGWANRADYIARLAAPIEIQVRVMKVYRPIATHLYTSNAGKYNRPEAR